VLSECQQLAGTREILRSDSPRIIILDKALGMQAVLDWIADLKILLSRRNVAPSEAPAVVVWGVSMTESEALRFLQAGARGIIRKTASPKALLACLRAVAEGKNWMEDSVFRDAPPPSARPHRSDLTPREQQVMELVEQGLKNREIARELGIRPGTVKIHLKHIFEKTGVRGRYGLALTGMREKGLLALNTAAIAVPEADFDELDED
jgi:DNA-binding NarL/FixJ family response regulator